MRYKRPSRRVRGGAERAVGGRGGGRAGRTAAAAASGAGVSVWCHLLHHGRHGRSGADRVSGAEHAGESASSAGQGWGGTLRVRIGSWGRDLGGERERGGESAERGRWERLAGRESHMCERKQSGERVCTALSPGSACAASVTRSPVNWPEEASPGGRYGADLARGVYLAGARSRIYLGRSFCETEGSGRPADVDLQMF